MKVRITQLDGSLPNLALMHLSAWHRAQGDDVRAIHSVERELGEPSYDRVYASAIFTKTGPELARFRSQFPEAIVGGTGANPLIGPPVDTSIYVPSQFVGLDYSTHPGFTASLGFSQRGCRFKCGFCVVPGKEGRPKPAGTIAQIWRGPGFPKHLHLLDNDFFGNPLWRDRIAEIRDGDFKVCINQGVNIRVISDEAAAALASIEFRDVKFRRRRLYTAWDNLGDERVFFRGVDRLEHHGIPPTALMAYMLVGYAEDEDWPQLWHRFGRMVDRGVMPYIMPFEPARGRVMAHELRALERWVNMGLYRFVSWDDYQVNYRTRRQAPAGQLDWLAG